MGKERHKRRKLHASAPKVKPVDQDGSQSQMAGEKPQTSTLSIPVLGENIFADVKIGADQLTPKKLPDFDAVSTVTSKDFRGRNMKKKDKQKIRHEIWMKKVDALQVAKKEAKAKKKREKTVIVGDLKPLEDTLPTLELLLKETGQKHEKAEAPVSNKAINKESVRKKQMMDNINLFQQVWSHPSFKSDPGAAITEHLREKLKQEEGAQS